MKINKLKISNVLSFKHYDDFSQCPEINFKENLNILIGTNGSGKTTVLEVLNFIFSRTLLHQYSFNESLFDQRGTNPQNLNEVIFAQPQNYSGLRLDPNWNTPNHVRKLNIEMRLDAIDKENIQNLQQSGVMQKILVQANRFSKSGPEIQKMISNSASRDVYEFDITLKTDPQKTFSVSVTGGEDFGSLYLKNLVLLKFLIRTHNIQNPADQIIDIADSFVSIGSYRNYNQFTNRVALNGQTANQQIDGLLAGDKQKSLNQVVPSEPAIFGVVRLQLAKKHFDDALTNSSEQALTDANNQEFLKKINKKLELVNLKIELEFIKQASWEYGFKLVDLKRSEVISDINLLSSGQKAILHLVLESYGRGEMKGGVVIIDEPELHLHYQFQHEYLQIIESLNKELDSQFILVTHSESLITSKTIDSVTRFTLDDTRSSIFFSPVISTDQKWLVKILDNTKSSFVFFANKVVLVEGDTDRYFFREALSYLFPEQNHQVAILDISGKGDYEKWKTFFELFGLKVYFIGDLDCSFKHIYSSENPYKLSQQEIVDGFKCTHPDLISQIESKYADRIFILKEGDLEHYLGIHNKGIPETIRFCNEKSMDYFTDAANALAQEIKNILTNISNN